MKSKRKSLAVITLLALLLQSVTLGFLPSPAVAVTTCAQGGVCIVGDIGPGGGIVFYVADTPFTATGTPCGTNCYYLEAATSGTNAWTDAAYAWSGNTNTSIGGTGTAIGSGYANTLAIVGQSGGGSTASRAGTITRAYRGNNLSDWYLPSKSELAEMWKQWNQWYQRNEGSILGLVRDRYFWSSSESQTCCAWVNKFDPNNTITDFAKSSSAYVRPIRAFSNTPGAPTIGTVAANGATAISIPYTAGAISGSAITGYTTTSSPFVSLTLTSTATANPLTYSGTFVQGQSYTFTIAATNGAGSGAASSASNSVTPFAAGPPDAPTIGIGTVIDSQTVSIPFTAPANNGSSITSYSVSSSPSIALTYSGTTSPMAVTGTFVQDQAYTFTIAATNGAGSGAASSASNSVTPFAAGPPDAPTIGIGTVIDSQTVTVSFSAPVNNRGATITNYTATSSPGGITASSANSPITVTGLTVNTAYTFTVTATNSAGTSDSSTATSSVTPKMTYSVTFNSQGGSSISDGSFISGESVTVPGSNPTRSGYTYNGWFATATGGSVLVFPYSPGVTSNITLYAQWTVIPVVVPPAPTPAPVIVSGPPPSTLKTLSTPKISRDNKGYYCEVGKYVFLREGRTEETPKLTTQVFSLLVNGKVIDSVKSIIDKVSFANSDSYMNSTLTCQVEVGQENLSTTSYSLNSADMASYSLVKKNAIEAADAKYYKDRQDAYTKKDLEFARLLAVKNAGVGSSKTSKDILAASLAYQKAYSAASNLWKKELADAATNRVLAKELAQTQYLDALESAGISIYQTPGKEVVTPTPTPTPTPEPTPTPTSTPVVTTNPQPTAQMVKVGTINMASGSYSLNDATKITLKAIALKINASDAKSILVYGHTESRGGVNNTVLSQNRAKAVANYLRPLFKGKKITVGWYASRKPVAGGNTAADLAKNRRVEIYSK